MKKGKLFKSSLLALTVFASTVNADITPKEAMIDGLDIKIKQIETMPYSPFLGDTLGYNFENFKLFDENGSYYLENFKLIKQGVPSPVISIDNFGFKTNAEKSDTSYLIKGIKLDLSQALVNHNYKIINHLSNNLNENGGIDVSIQNIREDNNIKHISDIYFHQLLNIKTNADLNTLAHYQLSEVVNWDVNPLQYQALFDLFLHSLNSKDVSILLEDKGIVDSLIDNINKQRIKDFEGKVSPEILSHIEIDRKTAAGILRMMKQQMVETAISGRNGFGPYDEISMVKMWFMKSSLDALADFVETSKPIELNSLMKEGMNLHAFFTEVMKDTDAFLQTFSIQ